MKTYAHVADGVVREIVDVADNLTPGKDLFTSDFAVSLVDVTAVSPKPAQGWTYDGKAFAASSAAVPVRTALGYALLAALTDAQRTAYGTAVKPWDQRFLTSRPTPFPEDNPKIARAAAALGTTPEAWFDAALSVSQ